MSTTPALPRELQVEVTAACNLRCRMCLVRYQPPVDKVTGSMSLETFRRLLDGLPEVGRVTLQGLGEPLMAPDLMDMIAEATARGAVVGFNTNATLLTRARAEELVDAGLGWLHVSIDGATPATYEAIRDRARFERVTANVAGLVEVMRRKGAVRPLLRVVFVAQRSNYRELPDVVRLVAGWGVPELRVQNLSHDFSDTDPAGSYADIRDYAEAEALWGDAHQDALRVFDESTRLADELGVGLRLPDVEEPARPRAPGTPGCDWPWRAAYVTADAKVQPCCMIMGTDRAVLGDAARDSLDAIWGNDAYRRFREGLLSDEPPDVCRGCSWYRGVF
ncbi:MAG TPA: radical SAM protein [Acidimicrobiales bacterium]|nr:radical SAM protein [Acidimicrobiales bacterium]